MYKFRVDDYQKARGGSSRVLDVVCENCGAHLTYYQKDGPGPLKRMYADRFIETKPSGRELTCLRCQSILGTLITYQKEDRLAYRLYVGAVIKKIVSKKRLN